MLSIIKNYTFEKYDHDDAKINCLLLFIYILYSIIITVIYLFSSESERIQKGYKSAEEERLLDIEAGKPMRLTYKVSIPTEKYPNVCVEHSHNSVSSLLSLIHLTVYLKSQTKPDIYWYELVISSCCKQQSCYQNKFACHVNTPFCSL